MNDRKPPFTWEELLEWRWGPAVDDPTPGIDNPGRPFNPETFARAMDPEADPYNRAEREAIQTVETSP